MILLKHQDIILNSITQTKEKWSSLVLSRADLLNGMKVPWYCIFSFFFFFLFTTNSKKRTLAWNDFCHGYGNYCISKVIFWKLLNISYVQSSFWTFLRQIDNVIWKISCSCRFYGNGSTYVLILPWLNIMTQKWVKVPGKLSPLQKSESVLWRTCLLLLYSSFFLK